MGSKRRAAAARRAAHDRFEREVDPDGTLPPEERARRAESARKARYSAMALKSCQGTPKRSKLGKKPRTRYAGMTSAPPGV